MRQGRNVIGKSLRLVLIDQRGDLRSDAGDACGGANLLGNQRGSPHTARGACCDQARSRPVGCADKGNVQEDSGAGLEQADSVGRRDPDAGGKGRDCSCGPDRVGGQSDGIGDVGAVEIAVDRAGVLLLASTRPDGAQRRAAGHDVALAIAGRAGRCRRPPGAGGRSQADHQRQGRGPDQPAPARTRLILTARAQCDDARSTHQINPTHKTGPATPLGRAALGQFAI